MSKYELIEEVRNPKRIDTPKLPVGIRYDTMIISTYGAGNMEVHVPTSTSVEFTEALNEYTVVVTSDVKRLLHKFRGITGL
jgi:hypothetical protein